MNIPFCFHRHGGKYRDVSLKTSSGVTCTDVGTRHTTWGAVVWPPQMLSYQHIKLFSHPDKYLRDEVAQMLVQTFMVPRA